MNCAKRWQPALDRAPDRCRRAARRVGSLTLALGLAFAGLPGLAQTTGLRHVPRSTVKLEQLIGDEDKERRQPTLSQTLTRFQIQGTDLGSSFEHDGKLYFLFGDTVGRLGRALDTIATTDALQAENGVRLDFLMRGDNYLTIDPPGLRMGAFEVPLAGLSLGGQAYIAVRSNHTNNGDTARSYLTRFNGLASFEVLRTLSQRPAGRFLNLSMRLQPTAITGLPDGGPFVLIWGAGAYRQSDAYLSIVPAANIETGKGTLYYAGSDTSGMPVWSEQESAAVPVVRNGTIGDLSVIWNKELQLWLMTYDSRPPAPRGVLFAYASKPWGPWSEPQNIFNPVRDGALGRFIHNPDAVPDDGLAGPVIGAGQGNPGAVRGGIYAPFLVERFSRVESGQLRLYFVLSTWNPYVVVLMMSRFGIE